MNKLLKALCLLFLVQTSCKTDVDLIAPYKEIMVVYGVLNASDTVQYIRINKAFLGQGNAYQYAQVADSFQYKDILDVTLERYKNNTLIATLPLERFEGPPLDSGIFASSPNILYRTINNAVISQDSEYKLIIHNRESGKTVTSKTVIVNKIPTITSPTNFQSAVDFADPNNTFIAKFSRAPNAKYYDLKLRFSYYERLKSNPSIIESKSIEWIAGSTTYESTQTLEIPITYSSFYLNIKRKINPDPGVDRIARGVDFIFIGGATELYTYVLVNKPSTGIVQSIPNYTNIADGVGIFSSIYSETLPTKLLTIKSLDSLIRGQITGDLGFVQ
jgi:hypothetical protein